MVQSVENHPNSEKLYVCHIVDVGGGFVKIMFLDDGLAAFSPLSEHTDLVIESSMF